jgi:hypothetical protein
MHTFQLVVKWEKQQGYCGQHSAEWWMTGLQPVHTFFQVSVATEQVGALVQGVGFLNSAGECLNRKNDQEEGDQQIGHPGFCLDWPLDRPRR